MTATLLRSATEGRSRLPRRTLLQAAIAVVLLAALATWLVAFSSVFGVGTVEVRGEHTLSQAQVRSVADIADGTPLVRLDTDAIRVRLEALPDVASATVTTSFPSTVTITLVERVAIGVAQVDGGFRLVDATGEQFRTVVRRPAHLPLFVVPAGTDARATLRAVATVAATLPSVVRSRIASIQALEPTAITLVLVNGRTVQWGSADRTADKARILATLLGQPGTQFDVSNPDLPFVR